MTELKKKKMKLKMYVDCGFKELISLKINEIRSSIINWWKLDYVNPRDFTFKCIILIFNNNIKYKVIQKIINLITWLAIRPTIFLDEHWIQYIDLCFWWHKGVNE